MFVYIAVVLVVAVMLVVSYWALSGGEPLDDADYRAALVSLGELAAAGSAAFGRALSAPAPEDGGADPLIAAAGAGRKRFAAFQQQLARYDSGACDELEVARAHLSMAIENLGWACRMIEPGSYRGNNGMQRAVEALRDGGEGHLAEAARRLPAQGGG